MSAYRRAMLAHLQENDTASREELASAAGAPSHVAQRQLGYAVDLGFIVEADPVNGQRRYTLPAGGRRARETERPVRATQIESDVSRADLRERVARPTDHVARFDPSDHTVDEVRDYLNGEDVDDAERRRVLAAERAAANRKTLVSE